VAPAASSAAVQLLQRDLDRTINTPALDRTLWAVVVQAAASGEMIYRLNPTKLVMPASNMKILTLAASAERLGWDYVFETRLYATGPIERGVLRGDLIVVGSGDPDQRRDGSPRRVSVDWASRLRRPASRPSTGASSATTGRSMPRASARAGRGITSPTATPRSARCIARGSRGRRDSAWRGRRAPASIEIRPGGSGLTVENAVITSAAGGRAEVDARRLPGSGRLRISGTVPLGSGETR
jgi:D-alanyl-D-alanine carboxypeptidase/D-alanyl-D-alanine-endopeptidase (penicillin-binding protein 4)